LRRDSRSVPRVAMFTTGGRSLLHDWCERRDRRVADFLGQLRAGAATEQHRARGQNQHLDRLLSHAHILS
jgi:uncharacterized protein (DUF3084 family)